MSVKISLETEYLKGSLEFTTIEDAIGFLQSVKDRHASSGVRILSSGLNKIQVIKVIREYTGLGLKESKDVAESNLPFIKQDSEAKSRMLCTALCNAGATAEIV